MSYNSYKSNGQGNPYGQPKRSPNPANRSNPYGANLNNYPRQSYYTPRNQSSQSQPQPRNQYYTPQPQQQQRNSPYSFNRDRNVPTTPQPNYGTYRRAAPQISQQQQSPYAARYGQRSPPSQPQPQPQPRQNTPAAYNRFEEKRQAPARYQNPNAPQIPPSAYAPDNGAPSAYPARQQGQLYPAQQQNGYAYQQQRPQTSSPTSLSLNIRPRQEQFRPDARVVENAQNKIREISEKIAKVKQALSSLDQSEQKMVSNVRGMFGQVHRALEVREKGLLQKLSQSASNRQDMLTRQLQSLEQLAQNLERNRRAYETSGDSEIAREAMRGLEYGMDQARNLLDSTPDLSWEFKTEGQDEILDMIARLGNFQGSGAASGTTRQTAAPATPARPAPSNTQKPTPSYGSSYGSTVKAAAKPATTATPSYSPRPRATEQKAAAPAPRNAPAPERYRPQVNAATTGAEVQYFSQFGISGKGKGEFNLPRGVVVHEDRVYVIDCCNHRVQVFTLSGQFITQWGSLGRRRGEFFAPRGGAVYNNELYVADCCNHRIQVFTLNGKFLREWGSLGRTIGKFDLVWDVAVDHNGVYCTDWNNHRVCVFNHKGTYKSQFGRKGTEDGEFLGPNGVCCDGEGLVYVVDDRNHRIQVFDGVSGKFVRKWGCEGSAEGFFHYPKEISFFKGRVYVSDTGNHRVQEFDTRGYLSRCWGTRGSGDGEFEFPAGISVGEDGIYVADEENNRIQRFK